MENADFKNGVKRRYVRPQITSDRLQVISSHLVGLAHRYDGRVRRLRTGNTLDFSVGKKNCGVVSAVAKQLSENISLARR